MTFGGYNLYKYAYPSLEPNFHSVSSEADEWLLMMDKVTFTYPKPHPDMLNKPENLTLG